jgi:hypothetical protein
MKTGWKIICETVQRLGSGVAQQVVEAARSHAANPLSRTTLLAVQLNSIR